jgi:hypothetical protein
MRVGGENVTPVTLMKAQVKGCIERKNYFA